MALSSIALAEPGVRWVDKVGLLVDEGRYVASLIPDAMSTTLFTIAGMEQFVPAFLGDEPPPAENAVTVQRCLRVAGAKVPSIYGPTADYGWPGIS